MKTKQLIAYILILTVNLFFGLKYFNRYTGQGILLSVLLLSVQGAIIYYLTQKALSIKQSTIQKIALLVIVVYFGILLFSHFYIDVNSLRVDKWSILQAFYAELFKGNYPYNAQSNIGNPVAPMPFYFVLFYPFYWVGEVGILCTLGYVSFIRTLQQKHQNANIQLLLIALLSTSLFTYWEITARSNIFFNAILILSALNYYSSIDKTSINKHFVLSAIFTGLALSTRSIFIVVYVSTFLSSLFRQEIHSKQLLVYGLISSTIFALTFFPLLIFYWDEFWVMNPFMVQASVVIPTPYVIGFILLGFAFPWFIKKKEDQFFYGGLILFIVVSIFFLLNSQGLSLKQALLIEGSDFSYFIFSVPFLMLYILQSSKDGELAR